MWTLILSPAQRVSTCWPASPLGLGHGGQVYRPVSSLLAGDTWQVEVTTLTTCARPHYVA